MRKITLLLVAALISATSFAQKPLRKQAGGLTSSVSVQKQNNQVLRSGKLTAEQREALRQQRNEAKANKKFKAAKKVVTPVSEELISETPAGTQLKNYIWSSNGYYPYWFWIYDFSTNFGVGNAVVTDDKVYIKNPSSKFATDTWIVGDRNGEDVVFHLPQLIYYEADYDYYYYVARATGTGENLEVDENNQDIKFTYKDGVLKQVDDAYIGVFDLYDPEYYGYFYGYADKDIEIRPNPYTATELPASATPQTYALQYTDNNGENAASEALVAFDGSDVYFQTPSLSGTDSWIKGTVSGNKITATNGQYLGVNEQYNSHLLLATVNGTLIEDEDYGDYYSFELANKDLEFEFDPDTKGFTTEQAFAINGSEDDVYYLEALLSAKYNAFTEVAATPADPEITYFEALDYDYGYGDVEFNIPAEDVDGNFILPSKIYYNIFFDEDEPFTLYTDEYVELEEDLTNIPYDFTDDWDIYATGATHTVYFYVEVTEKVGVQTIYTGGGETRKSNITWLYLNEDAAVKGISENSKANGVAYFDLTGRRIAQPQNGLFIKETTYANGTKKAVKVLKK